MSILAREVNTYTIYTMRNGIVNFRIGDITIFVSRTCTFYRQPSRPCFELSKKAHVKMESYWMLTSYCSLILFLYVVDPQWSTGLLPLSKSILHSNTLAVPILEKYRRYLCFRYFYRRINNPVILRVIFCGQWMCEVWSKAYNILLNILWWLDNDECLTNNGGCSVNARCTNTRGSFYCTCNAGFSGDGFMCTGMGHSL